MKKGKNWFIRAMAAEFLCKRIQDVTEAQYKVAKTLFLGMAYNVPDERLEELRNELRSC